MAIYKLPKQYSTNFKYPNKQPRTLVECDPKYGKVKCYIPSQGGMLDIQKGKLIPYIDMDSKADLGGVVTNSGNVTSRVEISTEGVNKNSGAWLFRLKRDSSGVTNYLMDSEPGGRHLFLFTASSTFQYYTNTGVRINASASVFPPFGEYFNMAVTWPESELWINGELITTGTTGAPTGLGTTYKLLNRITDNEPFLGSLAFFAILDGEGKKLVKGLTSDPYKILKPKTPPVYFTAAAAGGGFQAAWAMVGRQNNMIGGM